MCRRQASTDCRPHHAESAAGAPHRLGWGSSPEPAPRRVDTDAGISRGVEQIVAITTGEANRAKPARSAPSVVLFICANCVREPIPRLDWPIELQQTLLPCTGKLQPEHLFTPETVSWYPSSDALVVTGVTKEGRWVLLRMDLQGGSQILLESDHWLADPAPSPDGRRLAYTANSWELNAWLLEGF